MKICYEFIIKDLFDYMIMNEIDILEELESCNLFVMIDLIKIGNKCSEEEAEATLDKYINEYGLEAVVDELAYEVIGHKPDENEEIQNSKEFQSFSDILENFYNQIQAVDSNLSISEYMNMSTRYMYRYADGLQKRFINNENKELRHDYMLANMILGGFVGKLKECPQLDDDGSLHKQSNEDKIKAFFAGRSNNNG